MSWLFGVILIFSQTRTAHRLNVAHMWKRTAANIHHRIVHTRGKSGPHLIWSDHQPPTLHFSVIKIIIIITISFAIAIGVNEEVVLELILPV